VIQDFFERPTAQRISLQQSFAYTARLVRHGQRIHYWLGLYKRLEDVGIVIVEGQEAIDHEKEDDADGPCVGLSSVVRAVLARRANLGCAIMRRAASGSQQARVWQVFDAAVGVSMCRIGGGRETKVGEFDVMIPVEEYIFWLDVAMTNAAVVAKHDGVGELIKSASRSREGERAILLDRPVEFALGSELKDHVELVWGAEDLAELDDIRVVEGLLDGNLALQLRGHGRVGKLLT
jgi:hypothetical protein